MTKIKVSELKDELLDYWVAKAEGYSLERYRSGYRIRDKDNDVVGFIGSRYDTTLWNYSPSSDWSQGGPIIEREDIFPSRYYGCSESNPNKYQASGLRMSWERGPTPLIAAMRCFVASKFGEEFDDGE